MMFGVKLYEAQPRVCKIKRDTLIVELVADQKQKKQADALQELLDKLEDEEKLTWGQQIKKSVMLHPTVDEDGNIEDVACGDAIFHFISVFWKVLFSINPPPHYGGGWPSFFGSLFWIGAVTMVVAEIANLMGCVLGILPGVTAITFVAIGTSIPDTFASKIAAQQERYADEAVGNVTGSNSVNVFLGLGIPWIIATVYAQATGTIYEQTTPGLASSVLLFIVVSLIGISILVIRRFMYKGELGGPIVGRIVSCALFIFLWFVYITISTLGSYGILFKPEAAAPAAGGIAPPQ